MQVTLDIVNKKSNNVPYVCARRDYENKDPVMIQTHSNAKVS